MKKWNKVLLSGCLVMGLLAGCGSKATESPSTSAEAETTAPAVSESASVSVDSGSTEENQAEVSNFGNVTFPEVEDQVLVDQDGIYIRVSGMDYKGILGPDIHVEVQNNSDKTVYVSLKDRYQVTVNGELALASIGVLLEPGEAKEDTITILQNSLDDLGIDTIETIGVELEIQDYAVEETMFETGLIELKTVQ